MSARTCVVVCSFVILGCASAGSAQELWVAPTYQADLGGIGVGSNGLWPVTAIGAVRFAFAVPVDLQSVRSAKIVMIPGTSAASATLTIYVCHAQNNLAAAASCSGPVNHAFTSVANQLKEVDISGAVGPHTAMADAGSYVAVLAYTTPTAMTDHIVGMRFSYTTPLVASTLGDPSNIFLGYEAVEAGPAGHNNTAVGGRSMLYGTEGSNNTAVGYASLFNLGGLVNTGAGNTGVGSYALNELKAGSYNTAVGSSAMLEAHDGSRNAALGTAALSYIGPGNDNTALGYYALASNNGGNRNTAVGANALGVPYQGLPPVNDSIAIGYRAGFNAVVGNHDIYIGHEGAEESNTLRIGSPYNAAAESGQNRTFVAGIRGVTTGLADAVSVVIDSAGQLGTISSSARYKEDVADMGRTSSGLMRLRPVQFRYRQAYADGSRPLEYGLIAEEVARVYPDLVVYGSEGPETVQYHKLIPMLLNELQKQSQQLEELKSTIAELRTAAQNRRGPK